MWWWRRRYFASFSPASLSSRLSFSLSLRLLSVYAHLSNTFYSKRTHSIVREHILSVYAHLSMSPLSPNPPLPDRALSFFLPFMWLCTQTVRKCGKYARAFKSYPCHDYQSSLSLSLCVPPPSRSPTHALEVFAA